MQILESHYRKFLGPHHTEAWVEETSKIIVLKFDNTPDHGLFSFATVGVSKNQLKQAEGDTISQEYVVTVDQRFQSAPIEKVLFSVARLAIESQIAFPSCYVLQANPSQISDFFEGTSALFFCPPLYFDDDFEDFEDDLGITVISSVVPLTEKDAQSIILSGPDTFITKVNDGAIDVLNWARK